MNDNRYAIAYTEVLEILKYIPIEEYNKIPKTKIEMFEAYANSNYKFNYDPNKPLEEQNVSDIAKGVIILLFRDYWATEAQRNKIIAKQNYDRMKSEEKKKEKYNSDNIFDTQYKDSTIDNEKNNQDLALVNTNNTRWYQKIWSFFRKILMG